MKIIHLADIHLGLRQYQRQTSTGINQRESDMAFAFSDAIAKTIAERPDVVLIAGDVFHNVRPTNPAILHAYKEFARLMRELPDVDVVMVAGNHDLPRTAETGCLLGLFTSLGIRVVVDKPEYVSLKDGRLSVFAVPYGLRERPKIQPNNDAEYNILLVHDVVEGVYEQFGGPTERTVGTLTLNEIAPDRWSYVALGHYHVYHELAPNAYYSGALEYSSNNIWFEVDKDNKRAAAEQGKGFIVRDLETGTHRFQPVERSRRVVDLDYVDASGLTAEQVSERIRETIEKYESSSEETIDDCLVRLIVTEIPRHIVRDLDHRVIRDYKRRALSFLLDTRRPLVRADGSGAPGRRASLTETVRGMLERRAITPGIDRAALVELGMHYLAEADRNTTVTITAVE